jgi:hypothetical protein
VVYGREGNLRLDLVAEILEHNTIEILGIVNCHLLQNLVTTNDVLLEKVLYGCRGYVGVRLRFDPLGEIFHHYNGEGVISLCWREFANDVDALPLQRPRWGDQL